MKEILKESIILYVEDDKELRNKVKSLLKLIFKKVLIAEDGEKGLELYFKNKKDIDVIVSDINMPNLNGIDLLKTIRKDNKKIPFILSSAYTETEYLIESIKYNVSEYIPKPIDIKNMLSKIADLCKEKDNTQKLILKEKEIKMYLDALNKVAIVSKTDLKGNITYVNDIFCEIAQYSQEELLGKSHNIVRHLDMPKSAFQILWSDIKKGNQWQGKVKNKAKDGTPYYVNATIFPLYDNSSKEITGYIGIRFLTTAEENEKREFKKKVIVNIKESKQKEYQLINTNNELELEIKRLTSLDNENNEKIIELNKYLYNLQELYNSLEKKNISKERQLTHYELQMGNIDKRNETINKNKKVELKKYIQENEQLKNDKDLLIQKEEVFNENINTLKSKNISLAKDNIKKLKRIQELEDVIKHIEDKVKK